MTWMHCVSTQAEADKMLAELLKDLTLPSRMRLAALWTVALQAGTAARMETVRPGKPKPTTPADRLLTVTYDRALREYLAAASLPAVRALSAGIGAGLGSADLLPLGEAAVAEVRDVIRAELPPVPEDAATFHWQRDELDGKPWVRGHASWLPRGWLPAMRWAVEVAQEEIAPRQLARARTRDLKEKFGSLRWYGDGLWPPGLGVLASLVTEEISQWTCAACGKPGQVRYDRDWYLALCDTHAAMDAAEEDSVAAVMYPPRPGEGRA